VLLTFRALVPFQRVDARFVREITLPKTVRADHLQRVASSFDRQENAPVGDLRQTDLLHPVDQRQRPRGRQLERTGQARERARVGAGLVVVDVLEGVLQQRTPRELSVATKARDQTAAGPEHGGDRQRHGHEPHDIRKGVRHRRASA
jgi:hypothetical protein